MKKIFLYTVLFIFSMANLWSQAPSFKKGWTVINLSAGIRSTLYSGTFYDGKIPPLTASLEYGMADHILEKGVVGVGPYAGYSTFKYVYAGDGWDYSSLLVGIKGNFHYPLFEDLDTYTGLILGYNKISHKEIGEVEDKDSYMRSKIAWSWFIGARFYLTETIAVMGELGYGIAYINLGLAVRFY